MKILVINSGSTSLKYQLIDTAAEDVLAKGICERIGQDPELPTHNEALSRVIKEITDPSSGAIKDLSEIGAVGHRVVHGGEYFSGSVIADDAVIEKIEELSDLAPLHNPANLLGIKACMKLMPDTPNVCVFDTAFHQTMPEEAYIYGIPYEYYKKYKLRRYGFHGTSHSYVSERALQLLDKKDGDTKIVVAHLGGGASISAVLNGKSIDTSMGLTPLDGLVMGTRSGSIDPAIIQYIADKENRSADDVLTILNKKSGLFGIGGSADMRDIEEGYLSGDEGASIAFRIFIYSVVKMIGAYIAAMNGVDLIAFTAGIGEHDSLVRKEILKHFGYLGIDLDEGANEDSGEVLISTPQSRVKVWVIPTNEELKIARETLRLTAGPQ